MDKMFNFDELRERVALYDTMLCDDCLSGDDDEEPVEVPAIWAALEYYGDRDNRYGEGWTENSMCGPCAMRWMERESVMDHTQHQPCSFTYVSFTLIAEKKRDIMRRLKSVLDETPVDWRKKEMVDG